MRFHVRSAALSALLAAGIAGAAGAQQAAPGAPKFAFVDSRIIMDQAPGRAEAQAQLEREIATYRQQVQRMGDSLNTMISDYNKQEITLSPTAKEAKQKAIRAKEEAYQTRTQQLQAQAQTRQEEVLRPITEQVKKVIDDIRTEDNYTMIFDVGSGAGVLISADKNLDITDRVVARLQTVASKAAGTARPAATAPTGAAPAPAGVTRPKSPPTQ